MNDGSEKTAEQTRLMLLMRMNATKAAHPLMGEGGADMCLAQIARDLTAYKNEGKPKRARRRTAGETR